MTLGDTHIESPVRHGLHQDIHRAARGHGRYAHYPWVLASQLQQRLAEHVLVFGRLVGAVGHYALARLGIKLARSMPDGSLLLCGLVALTLYGMQM